MVLYTRTSNQSAFPANVYGEEIAVLGNKLIEMRDRGAGLTIPAGGYVLSGHGTARSFLLNHDVLGNTVTISSR